MTTPQAATIAAYAARGYRVISHAEHDHAYRAACAGRGPWQDEILIDGDAVLPNDSAPYPWRVYMRREDNDAVQRDYA